MASSLRPRSSWCCSPPSRADPDRSTAPTLTGARGARSGHPGEVGVPRPAPFAGWGRAEGPDGEGVLQRAETRHTIELSTGVRWERLTPRHDSRVDFLDVVYEPYDRSS